MTQIRPNNSSRSLVFFSAFDFLFTRKQFKFIFLDSCHTVLFTLKQKTQLFRVNCRLTKRFSECLRFIDSLGLFYKTKTPLISCQLASDKAFKRRSLFYRFTGAFLQNEDSVDFASIGVRQSIAKVFVL